MSKAKLQLRSCLCAFSLGHVEELLTCGKDLSFQCIIMADPDWAENSGIFKCSSKIQLPGYIFPLFGPIFRSFTGWRDWIKPKGGKAALQTWIFSATGATEPSRVQLTRRLCEYSSAFTPQAGCQQSACYHFPPLRIFLD